MDPPGGQYLCPHGDVYCMGHCIRCILASSYDLTNINLLLPPVSGVDDNTGTTLDLGLSNGTTILDGPTLPLSYNPMAGVYEAGPSTTLATAPTWVQDALPQHNIHDRTPALARSAKALGKRRRVDSDCDATADAAPSREVSSKRRRTTRIPTGPALYTSNAGQPSTASASTSASAARQEPRDIAPNRATQRVLARARVPASDARRAAESHINELQERGGCPVPTPSNRDNTPYLSQHFLVRQEFQGTDFTIPLVRYLALTVLRNQEIVGWWPSPGDGYPDQIVLAFLTPGCSDRIYHVCYVWSARYRNVYTRRLIQLRGTGDVQGYRMFRALVGDERLNAWEQQGILWGYRDSPIASQPTSTSTSSRPAIAAHGTTSMPAYITPVTAGPSLGSAWDPTPGQPYPEPTSLLGPGFPFSSAAPDLTHVEAEPNAWSRVPDPRHGPMQPPMPPRASPHGQAGVTGYTPYITGSTPPSKGFVPLQNPSGISAMPTNYTRGPPAPSSRRSQRPPHAPVRRGPPPILPPTLMRPRAVEATRGGHMQRSTSQTARSLITSPTTTSLIEAPISLADQSPPTNIDPELTSTSATTSSNEALPSSSAAIELAIDTDWIFGEWKPPTPPMTAPEVESSTVPALLDVAIPTANAETVDQPELSSVVESGVDASESVDHEEQWLRDFSFGALQGA